MDAEPEEPNRIVNGNDVLQLVPAFTSQPYPFGDPAVGEGDFFDIIDCDLAKRSPPRNWACGINRSLFFVFTPLEPRSMLLLGWVPLGG